MWITTGAYWWVWGKFSKLWTTAEFSNHIQMNLTLAPQFFIPCFILSWAKENWTGLCLLMILSQQIWWKSVCITVLDSGVRVDWRCIKTAWCLFENFSVGDGCCWLSGFYKALTWLTFLYLFFFHFLMSYWSLLRNWILGFHSNRS